MQINKYFQTKHFAGIFMLISCRGILSCGIGESRLAAIDVLEKLRDIRQAEEKYRNLYGNGRFGAMNELVRAELLAKKRLWERNDGYKIELMADGPTYQVNAIPPMSGGDRIGPYFFMDETGVIRANFKVNVPADKYSDGIERQ
ncbi:hypothetical protein BH10ACI2_BH10ACI2_17000 [soil metagenome]